MKNGDVEEDLDPRRSIMMSKVKGKNTKPEIVVRKLAHRLGYRFRLHRADLPGSPDLVFPARRKVIFVHGCFWHRHPNCTRASTPKTRKEFWTNKFEANIARDARVIRELDEIGWDVLIIWECETRNLERLVVLVKDFLSSSPPS